MENYMLEHVLSLPSLIEEMADRQYEKVENLIDDELFNKIKKIYIFGSGDSYNGAVACKQAFIDIAKIDTEVVNALQASRYLAKDTNKQKADESLAICISSSGEAARSVEAIYNLRKAGFHTLLVGASLNSRAGKRAELFLEAKETSFKKAPIPIPGIRSFIPPVISLYYLAINLAYRRGLIDMDVVLDLKKQIRDLGKIVEETFINYKDDVEKFGELIGKYERVEFISSGPGKGGFDFGVSKILEANGYYALSQDTEEYAHQTFFLNEPNHLPTVLLIASDSPYVDRALEIRDVLSFQTRPLLIVSDDKKYINENHYNICFNHKIKEVFIGLPIACLMSYLTSFIPFRIGDTYMHNHLGFYNEDNLKTVRDSKIIER